MKLKEDSFHDSDNCTFVIVGNSYIVRIYELSTMNSVLYFCAPEIAMGHYHVPPGSPPMKRSMVDYFYVILVSRVPISSLKIKEDSVKRVKL